MKRLVLLAALLTLLLPGPASAQQAPGKVAIDSVDASDHPTVTLEVSVPSSVSSATLSPNSFTVEEGGKSKAASVSQIKGDELDVVVLMDTTGSMGGGPIDEAKAAAAKFLQRLPRDTSVSIMGYDTRATVLSEFSADIVPHVNALSELEAGGETALYDAVHSALGQFEGRTAEQKAIVLLTDGEDNASEAGLGTTVRVLERAGVTLYGIEYRTAYTDKVGLGQLVGATDGRVVRAGDPRALDRVYGEIAAELSNHYTLTYRSTAAGPTDIRLLVATQDSTAAAAASVKFPAATQATQPAAKPVTAEGTVVTPGPFAHPAALIGGSVAVFVALAMMLFALLYPTKRRIRLAQSGGRAAGESGVPGMSAVAASLVQSVERTLEKRGQRRNLVIRLEQAGIALRAGEFAVVTISVMIVVGILTLVATNLLLALMASVGVALAARSFVTFKAERRRKAFGEQIADTLQLLAGSLRAGYGLMQAIDTVIREAPNPTAEEYRRLLVETRLGRDLDVALAEMADRLQLDDFTWVVQAFAIHREVGGDLAAVLDSITATVRERDDIRRQIQVLSAEGRLSMWILLALPFVTAAGISVIQPDYLSTLTGHPAGKMILFVSLGLMAVGTLWIRRIIRLVF